MKKNNDIYPASIFLIVFVVFVILTTFYKGYDKKEMDPENIKISQTEISYGEGDEDRLINEKFVINAGNYEYKSFTLNGELTVTSGLREQGITIRAKEKIIISKDAKIDLTGVGYIPFYGLDNQYAGSGGGSIGLGGGGDCFVKNEVGFFTPPIDTSVFQGQGAGAGRDVPGRGGNGGGFIALYAPEIIIEGKILTDGQRGEGSGGGGGGGKIIIIGEKVSVEGIVSVNGGNGGSSQIQGAGGGGGGLIMISKYSGQGRLEVSGGKGGDALDLYTGCSGGKGVAGKIVTVDFDI